MIEIENLTVAFGGTPVVHGVSFSVARGESFALVGESGSGKSTILKAIAGQAPDWTGQIRIGGEALRRWRDRAFVRRVQMVFQDPYGSLHPRRSVDDTLSEPLAVHGIGGQDARVLAMLDAVGLSRRFRFRLPHQLSGGQRQRVAIARALAIRPAIVLADEPTANLDHKTGEEILNLMKQINRAFNTTFIFSTHDKRVIAKADRLVRVDDGEISVLGVRAEDKWSLARQRRPARSEPAAGAA